MLYAMQRWKRPTTHVPPRRVAMGMAEKVGVRRRLSRRQKLLVTGVSHFAYGAAVGAPYGPLQRHIPLPPALGGAAWGLAVWGASYAGWLPAAGIMPPPTQKPLQRNGLLIATHLLWGSVMGQLTAQLAATKRQEPRRPIQLRRGSSAAPAGVPTRADTSGAPRRR